MRVARTAPELRRMLAARPDSFVPTLGALHDGHRSLLSAARAAADGVLVGSIFVNPLQFGPGEDFDAYPRNESEDLEIFRAEDVDVAFLPSQEEMYPPGRTTSVAVGRLGNILEGAHRPAHFDGVATVCAKLFNLVCPRRAFFGQKDAQQVAIIKRMVVDLNFDLDIVVCPTVRDEDGLALSSRNAYLTIEERKQATALYRALVRGRSVLESGGDPDAAQSEMTSLLASAPGIAIDYAVTCDADTFEAPSRGRPVLLAVAGRVGRARLIDNIRWSPDQ